jgi:hypothetical protein
VPTDVTVVFGVAQVGEFVKLYASARNCVVILSRPASGLASICF